MTWPISRAFCLSCSALWGSCDRFPESSHGRCTACHMGCASMRLWKNLLGCSCPFDGYPTGVIIMPSVNKGFPSSVFTVHTCTSVPSDHNLNTVINSSANITLNCTSRFEEIFMTETLKFLSKFYKGYHLVSSSQQVIRDSFGHWLNTIYFTFACVLN